MLPSTHRYVRCYDVVIALEPRATFRARARAVMAGNRDSVLFARRN